MSGMCGHWSMRFLYVTKPSGNIYRIMIGPRAVYRFWYNYPQTGAPYGLEAHYSRNKIILNWVKLVDHVGDHVLLSPEGAILVTFPGTGLSNPSPSIRLTIFWFHQIHGF